MVVFFSSLENHLLSLKLLIFNYFLRVKEDAWQICVEHFTVIWWWSSRSERVNAVQLQLWGIVIFVRFLSFLVTAIFFFVLWYSSSMHAWYTIPILITLSCIFLACMLVYISGFALDCLSSFTFVQNYCFALWYLGSTNSYVQGTGVVDSLIRWNHVRIYMFRLLSTSESTNRLWPFLPVMHNWDYLENCWKIWLLLSLCTLFHLAIMCYLDSFYLCMCDSNL